MLATAAVVVVAGWFGLRGSGRHRTASGSTPRPVPVRVAALPGPAGPLVASSAAAATSMTPAPSPAEGVGIANSAQPVANSAQPVANSAQPTASAVPHASPDSSAPEATAGGANQAQKSESPDVVTVEFKIRPYGSLVFQKGKQVGKCPFSIDLPRGEKRTYEVVAPGYVTRRVVVDGSKPTISFIMKQVDKEEED